MSEPGGGSHHVLVVDDDESTAELERRALRRAGIACTIAGSVRSALDALQREPFSAIILDYSIPGGDAWNVVEHAKAMAPRVPVILATGMGSERVAAEALQRDVAEYVRKATSFWDELPAAVDRVVRQARAEERTRRTEALFNLLSQTSTDIIIASDAAGTIRYVSQASEKVLGWEPAEIIGKTPAMLVHPEDIGQISAEGARSPDEPRSASTLRVRCKDGSWKWVESNTHAARDRATGVVTEIIAVVRDVTHRKRTEELLVRQAEELLRLNSELQSLSLRDPLTGLYNKRGFMTVATQKLKEAVRAKGDVSVVFADMDGLKAINDTYGHKEGDLAISACGEVLRSTFRDTDIIARIGGDEFALLLVDAGAALAEVAGERFQRSIDVYNARANAPYRLSMSLGFSRFHPGRESTIDDLLAMADKELYRQKRVRRNREA